MDEPQQFDGGLRQLLKQADAVPKPTGHEIFHSRLAALTGMTSVWVPLTAERLKRSGRTKSVAVGDGFDLRDNAGLAAVRNGNDFGLAGAGFAFAGSPVVCDGITVHIGEGAVEAGSQTEAGEQAAEAGDEENNALNDAGTERVLEVAMLDPAQQVLFCGNTDPTAYDEPKRRQHEPVAPRMQGTYEGPCKARDDERDDATKQDGGVQQKD